MVTRCLPSGAFNHRDGGYLLSPVERNNRLRERSEYVQPGMIFRTKEFVRFIDGTIHWPGQEIIVTDLNRSYFINNLSNYDAIPTV